MVVKSARLVDRALDAEQFGSRVSGDGNSGYYPDYVA